MKKLFFAIALAVCTLGVSTAQQPARQARQNHQQCQQHREGRPERQCAAQNPFEGLELTEAQQTQIAALQARCCQGCAPAQQCAEGQQCSEQAQQCTQNQTQCTEGQQCNSQRRQPCNAECRTNCLNELKQILTPEQYVKFLENCFVNKINCCKGNKHGNHERHGRPQREGRPQRAERANAAAVTVAQ